MEEWKLQLAQHGYGILFTVVFVDQVGAPIPGEFLLIAMGALAAGGSLGFPAAFAVGVVACLAADLVWYELGRRRGAKVLGFVCRVSLEPDTCVRKTETLFERRGPWILVFAKFLPGISAVAAPLAGLIRMDIRRFLLLDLAGCVTWVGGFMAIGSIFHGQLEQVTVTVAALGVHLGVVAALVIAGWIGLKWWDRRRTLARLRTARISPAELRRRWDAGEELLVVDLRSALDFASDPRTIPGARRIPAEELLLHVRSLPRDRDIVLYCT
jgi:membrane protein DedA with SNARE-associated domain